MDIYRQHIGKLFVILLRGQLVLAEHHQSIKCLIYRFYTILLGLVVVARVLYCNQQSNTITFFLHGGEIIEAFDLLLHAVAALSPYQVEQCLDVLLEHLLRLAILGVLIFPFFHLDSVVRIVWFRWFHQGCYRQRVDGRCNVSGILVSTPYKILDFLRGLNELVGVLTVTVVIHMTFQLVTASFELRGTCHVLVLMLFLRRLLLFLRVTCSRVFWLCLVTRHPVFFIIFYLKNVEFHWAQELSNGVSMRQHLIRNQASEIKIRSSILIF